MFNTQLPTPSPDDLRAFQHNPEAIRTAIGIKTDLLRAIQGLQPFSVIAVARQFFPGEDDFQAASKLGLEIAAGLRELSAHGEDCTSVATAEKARIAPAMGAAGRRTIEIAARLPLLDEAIRNHGTNNAKKRASLEAAGVTGDDLARLGNTESIGALIAEQAALRIESEALQQFISTGDERHLPAGFTIPDVLKVSIPIPKTELPAYLQAA